MRTRDSMRKHQGATTVEFALISVIFITLVMAIVEFGRWMSTMELASEATRLGARMAVVCDLNDATIKQRVQSYLPMLGLTTSQISVTYLPNGCNKNSCQSVTVSITGATFTPHIPFLMQAFPVPPFTTTLPRESMESTSSDGYANPVCS
jgi:Flp pilus assembly protein TadG